MIQRIKKSLKERKVRVFLMFLMFSSLAWFLNNLSERYTSTVEFNLEYVNTPKHLLLVNASKQNINVKLDGKGFQFLAFNFVTKTIEIDVSELKESSDNYFISSNSYRKQIEKQLSNSMKLVDIDQEAIYFDFQEIASKEVRVVSMVELNLAQNYLLDGDVEISPKTILVKGPKNEIDSITEVKTTSLSLDEVNSGFYKKIAVNKSEELINTTFSTLEVSLRVKVAKFSERMLTVPVQVINLPEDIQLQTFPNQIAIVCNAKVGILKELEPSNFAITVDYNDVEKATKKLTLKVSKKPKNLHSVLLKEKEVTYILKRE